MGKNNKNVARGPRKKSVAGWGGGLGKNKNMGGGRQNFPFRPTQDLKWNSPNPISCITGLCHVHSAFVKSLIMYLRSSQL